MKVAVTLDPSGRYHVCLHCRCNVDPLPKSNKSVGVDVGLNDVIVTSDEFHGGNPKHLRSEYRRLRRAQKALSRKQKGSRNREKAKRRVAKIHTRIAEGRSDFIHTLTTTLVRENQTICVESLNVKNMLNVQEHVEEPQPRPKPPSSDAEKRHGLTACAPSARVATSSLLLR